MVFNRKFTISCYIMKCYWNKVRTTMRKNIASSSFFHGVKQGFNSAFDVMAGEYDRIPTSRYLPKKENVSVRAIKLDVKAASFKVGKDQKVKG